MMQMLVQSNAIYDDSQMNFVLVTLLTHVRAFVMFKEKALVFHTIFPEVFWSGLTRCRDAKKDPSVFL